MPLASYVENGSLLTRLCLATVLRRDKPLQGIEIASLNWEGVTRQTPSSHRFDRTTAVQLPQ